MLTRDQPTPSAKAESEGQSRASTAPAISLPKGGGAIRGMGEKFAANPVTGTGSMTVPIATSPGRGGFGPQLALAYDSGAGNGPFGLGWNLSLPAITRKTDKGLPRYDDANVSDVFILFGAEDLVPVFKKDANGDWVRDNKGNMVIDDDPRTIGQITYRVRRYRPRIEGLFARIERWTNTTNATDTFWRSISKDNITTWYGKTAKSRIVDPTDATRIFSWLICESYDDKGNVIAYEYKQEDSAGIDLSQAREANRNAPPGSPDLRSANRYLKRILYGNATSLLAGGQAIPPLGPNLAQMKWLFEVIFDYGEGHYSEQKAADSSQHDYAFARPDPPANSAWPVRQDPFSSYRAGFEVRTYRLCRRVLMFHHFPAGPNGEPGYDGLVRSTEFAYNETPIASFIVSVTQSGYVSQPLQHQADRYLKKSLPPLEFQYSEATIDPTVREVAPDSLENLPIGLDGSAYQWVDLDGEGVSGILTEQAGGWFYKRNLSPINVVKTNGSAHVEARFAPVELVATKPNLALAGGAQFMDLAGDGQPDLVTFRGPAPGFYERTPDAGSWEPFIPFASLPVLDWDDPNLKFVDLTGDGHADLLITEDDVFRWHPSLAEEGFGPQETTRQSRDEETGPRLVFADGTQSIYLADMSGDGLTDLVRICNGAVCYWPNLGYGRFGAKVTMDNSPWFDFPDQFDQKRIRLADVDGSGLTDILYLHGDGVRIYFNQSGNSWSQPPTAPAFPRIDSQTSVTVVDLLGNGTACLVWSSPLPGDAGRQMRYIDLMGGQKPHLLVKTVNNLGAETVVSYAPSTKFYLADKLAGKPWITKLPFPVHCVEKVTVTDKWRQTAFSSTYSYHHGYFDGAEREFRGFGRVEQLDVESYGEFAQGNSASPYITDDKTLYQPPVKTVTWYHTGAVLERERILSQFAHEYFPRWFEDLHPDVINVLGDFQENVLPEPDLSAEDLSGDEWREALRACKGMMLRQEVYELDVDALERGEHRPVKLFSTAFHNCHIRRLQPRPPSPIGWERAGVRAVFLVAESEAITYHYELDLRPDTLRPDPRIVHTLNLQFDEYANVLQSVAVVYPRLGQFEDNSLPPDALALIRRVQRETHLAYTETRYTNDVAEADAHRLRAPCEVLTYELTGIRPDDADDLLSSDPRDNRYFTLDELRRFRLSLVHQAAGEAVPEIAYHQLPNRTSPQKRLVEHVRMLFFEDDSPALNDPLPFGQLGRLGLLYETYKLALTDDLLGAIFGAKLTPDVRGKLGDASISGYMSGATLATRFPGAETDGQYWIRSGIAGFAPDAAQHFFLPERYTDPFGNVTTLEFDLRDLFVKSSADALGNTTRVTHFDFRVLAPREMQDINGNRSEVCFDTLGMVIASAVKGKGTQADNLNGYTDTFANPNLTAVLSYFDLPPLTADQARARFSSILGNASSRFLYHFGERIENGKVVWGDRPAGACAVVREQHVASLAAGDPPSPLQIVFECSDGMGTVLMKRSQAEPEQTNGPLRWIVSGKTVLNNKGKPVKQYEPYFSARASCSAEGDVHEEVGVTPLMYYDAPGRLVRTEMPDGTFSRVEFSPWHVRTFDANDTVLESKWYADRGSPDPKQPLAVDLSGRLTDTPEFRAGWLAAQHANTPSLTILDSLGREVIAIAHNRVEGANGSHDFNGKRYRDERYLTFTKLDAEGKPLWIRDARGNLVMQYITPPKANNDPSEAMPANAVPCYDIAGNLLFQHSMDAGDRWMLMDAAGKPMLAWDFNVRNLDDGTTVAERRLFHTHYDALHRPVGQWLKINMNQPALIEAFKHIDTDSFKSAAGVVDQVALAAAQRRNLIGQATHHYDPSGLATVERVDFKGAVEEITRTLVAGIEAPLVDWNLVDRGTLLEPETLIQITEHDALGRMAKLYNWHRDIAGQPGHSSRVAVYVPKYNQRGALESETLHVRASKQPGAAGRASFTPHADTKKNVQAIKRITWNAKGQKLSLKLGNGTTTRYTYDPDTFRLVHLYTRRGATFTGDCAGNADAARPARPCGVQNLHYTYDPVGNITHIQDDAQQTIWFANQQVEPSSDYTYDALYRLIEATGRENAAAVGAPPHAEGPWSPVSVPSPDATRNYTQSYGYDSVGNVITMQHVAANFPGQPDGSWTREYAYAFDDAAQPASNRLWQTWQGGNRAQAVTYRHDPHGSMLNSAKTAPAQDIRWDWRDMIRALDLQGGGDAFYNYGIDKQRTRKRVKRNSGGSEDRIYLGGYELYRRYKSNDPTPVEEIESLHLFEGEQRVLLVDDVVVATLQPGPQGLKVKQQTLFRYQYGNHLGSVGVELDESARVISYEEFHPYGTSAYRLMNSAVKAPAKRYRYTGMERDEENGLSNHGLRQYSVSLGRWVSCDPIQIKDDKNVYAYVGNKSTGAKDPTGTQRAEQIEFSDNEGLQIDAESIEFPEEEGLRTDVESHDFEDDLIEVPRIEERSQSELHESVKIASEVRSTESDAQQRETAWQYQSEIVRETSRRSQVVGNKSLALVFAAIAAGVGSYFAFNALAGTTLVKTIAGSSALTSGTLSAGQTAWLNVARGVDRPETIALSFGLGFVGQKFGSFLHGRGGPFQWLPMPSGLSWDFKLWQTMMNLRTFLLAQPIWFLYGQANAEVSSAVKGTPRSSEGRASNYNQAATALRALLWNIVLSTGRGQQKFPQMFDDPSYIFINNVLFGNLQGIGIPILTGTTPSNASKGH